MRLQSELDIDKGIQALKILSHKVWPKWRNWQTRRIQNPVLATG